MDPKKAKKYRKCYKVPLERVSAVFSVFVKSGEYKEIFVDDEGSERHKIKPRIICNPPTIVKVKVGCIGKQVLDFVK